MRRITRLPVALLGLALLVTLANPACAQNSREDWQRVPAVFSALGISAGSDVADVGAGSGWFTKRLSPKVGASGRVFAVDIAEDAIRDLRELATEASHENVKVVHSEPDDPELPPQSVDAALVVNAYHHFDQHQAMLAGLREGLRPGGRLVIVEMEADEPDAPRGEQMEEHGLEMDFALRDLRRAGFQILERVNRLSYADHGGHEHKQWMVVARHPKSDAR
jgi:predicted methyltransferase